MKPHLKKTWCIGQLDSRFIAQMEQILWLYAQPYDPDYPVVCFDERPCFLIADSVAPLSMQVGRVYKEHYSDEKMAPVRYWRPLNLERDIAWLKFMPDAQKLKLNFQLSHAAVYISGCQPKRCWNDKS